MATAENVWAWSTTAADNAAADSAVNWAEGQDPGTVNNSARGMMAAIAKMTDVQSGNVTVGGTADAITITTGQTISSGHQALGFRICFKAAFTNTGAVTVAVDALSAVAIKRPNGDALSAGDIVSGAFHDIAFDGTNYRLFVPGAGGNYGSLSGSNTWTGTNVFQGNTTVGDFSTDTVVIKGTTVHAQMSALWSASSVGAFRTAIGLGTVATYNVGYIGATVPLLNGANNWSNSQRIEAAGAVPLYVVRPEVTSNMPMVAFIDVYGNHNGIIYMTVGLPGVPGSVNYANLSDERLKRSITQLADSGTIIDQLAPIRFRWGTEAGPEDFGFSAQQLHTVVPQAVVPGTGNPGEPGFIPWMMQHGRLEAILVAEIQALRARVAALEAG